MTRSIHRIQKRLATATEGYLRTSIKNGWVPVHKETAIFLMETLLPAVAERNAKAHLSTEDFEKWKHADPTWRQALIDEAASGLGEDPNAIEFLLVLGNLYLDQVNAVRELKIRQSIGGVQ